MTLAQLCDRTGREGVTSTFTVLANQGSTNPTLVGSFHYILCSNERHC